MSAPKALAELVINGARIFGKAMGAAGRQAVANARYKPEAEDTHSPGSSGSKNKITSDLQMSLDEAHLILNVKKDAKLEDIVASYERIFAANSPPEPPKEPEAGSPEAKAAAAAKAAARSRGQKKTKAITHSHYLQSKVYRALERIQAERIDAELAEAAPEAAAEGTPAAPAAGEGAAAEGTTQSPPPPGDKGGKA